MSEVTVSQLASDVGIPVDRLLKQLSEAGVSKQGADDNISEQEKMDLLNHLRRSHGKKEAGSGAGARKIALKRKTTTELHQPASGRATARSAAVRAAKTVSVEVRRKRSVTKPVTEDAAKQEQLLREAEQAKQALAEQAAQRRQVEEEADARRRAEEARRHAEEDEQRQAEEARLAAEDRLDPEGAGARVGGRHDVLDARLGKCRRFGPGLVLTCLLAHLGLHEGHRQQPDACNGQRDHDVDQAHSSLHERCFVGFHVSIPHRKSFQVPETGRNGPFQRAAASTSVL